jgi:uncharacterized membrane protein YdcZ (DUF606 family)
MFDFSRLKDWQYLSDPYPPTEIAHKNLFLIVAGASILVGFLVWLIIDQLQKKYEIYENIKFRLFYFWLFFGIISSILIFFRLAGVPYFGSRLLVLLFLLSFLIWFILILIYIWRKFPIELAEFKDKLRKERYLPKPKKRK